MRSLKAVFGVVALIVCLAVFGGWVAAGKALRATGGEIYIGAEREKAIRFLMERDGLSRQDAIAAMHRYCREQGARVIDRTEIPPGAIVDFYEVDGSKPGKDQVRILGTGRALAADSDEGLAFWRIFERAARRHGWDKALAAMRDLRQRGVVIAPAWFGGGATIAQASMRQVTPQAAAQPVRVAVICARFPEWDDLPPRGTGTETSYTGGSQIQRHYYPDPTGQMRNVDPNYDWTPVQQGNWTAVQFPLPIDWYIDSTGGPVPGNGWTGQGLPYENIVHPEFAPAQFDGPTNVALRQYWYKRMFDLNWFGVATEPDSPPLWTGSLRNYYWDNSHGVIEITGTQTDIYGWIESHHVLDRLPYPTGPQPVFMVQPGTPLIRPSSVIINADGVTRPVLRASFGTYNGTVKLTVLYRYEYLTQAGWSPPRPITLGLEQPDHDGNAIWVTVQLNDSNTDRHPDPYDNRRWTYVPAGDGWTYDDDGDPDTDEVDVQPWAGHPWSASFPAGGPALDPESGVVIGTLPYTWQGGQVGYCAQDQGCGELPNTVFTRADVLQPGPGNRFKSFDYYCHDHFVNTSRGPYQVEHLLHNGFVDDIAGDTPLTNPSMDQYKRPRPAPFDCGLPQSQGGSDVPNLGMFSNPGNDNSGNHSAGGMRADIDAAMADAGITLNGPYDRVMYVWASGVSGGSDYQTGLRDVSGWGSIIAHAGGNMVTIGERTGLAVVAHEFGHTFGMGDLYDMDFYTNALGVPPNPLKFECVAMGPYSIMAFGFGGVARVDAYHLVKLGWISGENLVQLTQDRPNAQIIGLGAELREPIIYKLPANPYYITGGVPPDNWQEYFLVEFRDKVGDGHPSAGGWYGDPSRRGVYIYHVDERFGNAVNGEQGGLTPGTYGQTEEDRLLCAIEQADGLYELERNLQRPLPNYVGTPVGPGNTNDDPFGVALSDGFPNRHFCQWDFNLDDYLGLNGAQRAASPRSVPTSYSHGQKYAGGLQAGTDTDSFVRVLNINVPASGSIATADIYVVPREIVVTGQEIWPRTVDLGTGTAVPVTWQGEENLPVLKLTLENNRNTGPGDYVNMSLGDVTVQRIRILESGSSPNDSDVKFMKLYADADRNGRFDKDSDALLATTPVVGQVGTFDGLSYEVPLGQTHNLFVVYDMSTTAQINPRVSVAADLPEPRYFWPQPPGTVQIKERLGEYQFGNPRFPIRTASVARVIEGTDTLYISSANLAPETVDFGATNVPVLKLGLAVDHDRVIVRRMRFTATATPPSGTTNPLTARQCITRASLWEDVNKDDRIDSSTDRLIANAVFSTDTDFLFDGMALEVNTTDPTYYLVGLDFTSDTRAAAYTIRVGMPDEGRVVLVDEDGDDDPTGPVGQKKSVLVLDPTDPTGRTVVRQFDAPGGKIIAGIDVVDPSGKPWQSDVFAIAKPIAPVLSPVPGKPILDSFSGTLSTTFAFRVRYTSASGLLPEYVRLTYQNMRGNTPVTVDMQPDNPADNDPRDGKDYILQISGAALGGYGAYRFYFEASDRISQAYYYGEPPANQSTPPGSVSEWIAGPVIGTPSSIVFYNFNGPAGTTDTYEEGRRTDPNNADRVYIRVTDPDENRSASQRDTVQVVVEVVEAGSILDTEDVTLTETGINTGVFEGSLRMIGTTAAPYGGNNNGWLNVEAGASGKDIQATYRDPEDLPNPDDIDSSQATAHVVDTTAPDQLAAPTASYNVNGVLTVTWVAPAQDGNVDVAGYNLYYSTSNFTDVTAAGVRKYNTGGPLPATPTSLVIADLPLGTYYLAVTAVDEVPNENRNVATVRVDNPGTNVIDEIRFTRADFSTDADQYEEGRRTDGSDRIYVWVRDLGANNDPSKRETVQVRITGSGPFADTVTFQLTETGPDTGIFTGSIPTIGRTTPPPAEPCLNAIAGPTGQVITATYLYGYTAGRRPDTDATPDTATVVDTIAPSPVTNVTVRLGSDNRSLDVSWTYDEAAEIDVDHYNVYYSTGQFSNVSGAGVNLAGTAPAGTQNFTIPGLTMGTNYYVAVTAVDEVPNENKNVTAVSVDDSPPVVFDRVPDDLAENVSRYAAIQFRFRDLPTGVDLDTIRVEWGASDSSSTTPTTFTDISGQVTKVANADRTEVVVTYTPPPWPADKWIWLRARAADRATPPNAMPDWAVWRFSVLPTTQGLAIVDVSPADGATGVPRDTDISFRVIDSLAAIVRDSISLTVNGVAVPKNLLTITGAADAYTVVYDPPTDFAWGQLVQCSASARDVEGNTATRSWSFTIDKDTAGPTITPVQPAKDATDVPVNSNIIVSITDDKTGVDAASVKITVTVGGAAVAGTLTWDAASGTATFDPTENLPYGTQVTVDVEAKDLASPKNRSTLSYQFTTVSRRYSIVGRIVDTAGKPISGVTVTLSGAASKSTATDGNGYYQFRDLLVGDYTVTPTKSGWSFTPANRRYTGLAQDVDNADFVGSLPTYALSGRVTLAGAGLQGVTITVDGKTAVTASDGTWRIADLPAGTYTVVPSLANYQFNPASRTATIANADVTGLDFEALPATFTISGTVTDSGGEPLEGVVVTADGRTAVTAANGRYQIGGITAATVNVTCQKAGYTFFWRDSAGNWKSGARAVTVPPDQTDINFVGYTVVSQTFAGGLYMVSVPCVPRDPAPAAVFGTDRVARYDPSAVPPRYLTARSSPNAEQLRVRPGRGFWVVFGSNVTLEVPGNPVPPDQPVSVAVAEGWNMLGNPWLQNLPVTKITALSGTIRPYVYTWDPIRATYLLIAAEPGVGVARNYVLPWEGMWVRALSLGTVSIESPGGIFETEEGKALQLDLGADGWWLAIEARAADKTDQCCAVGVRSNGPALAIEKPPAMPDSVYVAVTSAEGEVLSRSVLAAGRTSYQWDLVVTTDLPSTDVAVALPDLSKLPKDLQVTLTDLETGKSVYMRTTSQYSFRSGPEGATRHLRLTVAPKSVGGLVVTGASATAVGSRVTVSYVASAPCKVTARVLNIAGRVVRVIASDVPAVAGVNTLAWDGRNAAGSPVPAGRYLIELDAVADNGQRVKCVTHVALTGGR